MNAMIMSVLTAFGIAGFLGTPDLQKAMDECCAKRTESCCNTGPDNCCEKKMEGCCEKMKDECCTWTSVYDGKRTFKRHHCVQAGKTGTVRVEVKPEDRKPGDIEGRKTVGKRTERVYYRDVDQKPAPESKCASKDGCNFSFVTEGKRTVRQSYCEHGGRRVVCGEKAGECSSCLK
jgi:hypothetical protein